MLEASEKLITSPLLAPACELGDFDVEQCVEEMFQSWTTAAPVVGHERRAVRARFNPMISTRPADASKLPPLPRELQQELLELCSEIRQATKSRPLQTLMICGVEAGVGASFVARCLSVSLAEFKQLRIALLTVVGARPTGDRQRASSAPEAVLRRAVGYLLFRTERPNLMEIASVQGDVTLTDLLCGTDLSVALQQLKQEFDFIVVDTPTVALHAEVALLAAMMDGVILVAEQHVTPLRQLDQAYHRLGKVQANVLGIVLNRQQRI